MDAIKIKYKLSSGKTTELYFNVLSFNINCFCPIFDTVFENMPWYYVYALNVSESCNTMEF